MSILSVSSDKDLFKDPPPRAECPVCFIPMSSCPMSHRDRYIHYLPCCWKLICYECFHSILDEINMGTLKRKCVLCRMSLYSLAEMTESYKKRLIEGNDVHAHAFNAIALSRVLGYDLQIGNLKTNEELTLLKRGADIGSTDANFYLAEAYWFEFWNNILDLLSKRHGLGILRDGYSVDPYFVLKSFLLGWLGKEGFSSCGFSLVRQLANLVHSSHDIADYLARAVNLRDIEKAVYHYEIAAMGGNEEARFRLGDCEWIMGNTSRSMKHFMIAAKCGHDGALRMVGAGYRYSQGHVTKDDYATALRAHQRSCDEMKDGVKAKR